MLAYTILRLNEWADCSFTTDDGNEHTVTPSNGSHGYLDVFTSLEAAEKEASIYPEGEEAIVTMNIPDNWRELPKYRDTEPPA